MSDEHADVNNDSLLLEVKKAGSGVEINKTEDASTPSNKVRYVKTAILGMGYFAVGFNLSILGVALPTLAQNINVSIDQISPVIISRGGGYLVGSVIAGTLDGIIDIYITIIGSMLLMSSCLAFVPMALNTAMLFSLTVINAIGLGAFETVGNMYALYLWGEKVSPFLQFIHFCYCIGCALSPVMSKPFLNEIDHSNGTENALETLNHEVKYIQGTSIPYLSTVYIVMSAVGCFVSILFILLKICTKPEVKNVNRKLKRKSENKCFRYTIIALLFLIYFFYIGAEVEFLTYLFTFAISNVPGMRYSKDTATDMNTVFFVSVVVGQFIGILVAKKLSAKVVLIIDIVGLMVSQVVMLCLPYYASTGSVLFWVGMALSGVFAASVYGMLFVWAESCIVLNGRAASTFIVGGALGEMILPFPVGQLIITAPMTFLYFSFGYLCIMTLLIFGAFEFAGRYGKKTPSVS